MSHLRRLFACLLSTGSASAARPDKIDFTGNTGSSTIVGTVSGADGTATRDVTVNLTSGGLRLRVLD